VPIEVRSVYDPYTAWSENDYEVGEDKSIYIDITYFCIFFTVIFILAGIL
jgi:hypothetical protein